MVAAHIFPANNVQRVLDMKTWTLVMGVCHW